MISAKEIKSINKSRFKGRAAFSAVKALFYKVCTTLRAGNKNRVAAFGTVFWNEGWFFVGTVGTPLYITFARIAKTTDSVVGENHKLLIFKETDINSTTDSVVGTPLYITLDDKQVPLDSDHRGEIEEAYQEAVESYYILSEVEEELKKIAMEVK